jgi:hypothetical protein
MVFKIRQQTKVISGAAKTTNSFLHKFFPRLDNQLLDIMSSETIQLSKLIIRCPQ